MCTLRFAIYTSEKKEADFNRKSAVFQTFNNTQPCDLREQEDQMKEQSTDLGDYLAFVELPLDAMFVYGTFSDHSVK